MRASSRIAVVLGALCLFQTGCGALHGSEHVIARQLTIMDSKGRPRIVAGTDDKGVAQIVFLSGDGQERMRLEQDDRLGISEVTMNRRQQANSLTPETALIRVSSRLDDTAAIRVFDAQDRTRFDVYSDLEPGTRTLTVYDKDGQVVDVTGR